MYFFFPYLHKSQRAVYGWGEIKLPSFILHFDNHSLPVIQVRLVFVYSLFHFPGCYFFMLHVKAWPGLCPCGHDDMQHSGPSCERNRSKLDPILQLQGLGIQLYILRWLSGLASAAQYTAASVCRDFTLLLVFLYFAFLFYIQSSVRGGGRGGENTNTT